MGAAAWPLQSVACFSASAHHPAPAEVGCNPTRSPLVAPPHAGETLSSQPLALNARYLGPVPATPRPRAQRLAPSALPITSPLPRAAVSLISHGGCRATAFNLFPFTRNTYMSTAPSLYDTVPTGTHMHSRWARLPSSSTPGSLHRLCIRINPKPMFAPALIPRGAPRRREPC